MIECNQPSKYDQRKLQPLSYTNSTSSFFELKAVHFHFYFFIFLILHIIFQIQVIDKKGTKTIHDHLFSLDGTRVKTKLLPRLFLMPNLGMMVSVLIVCLIITDLEAAEHTSFNNCVVLVHSEPFLM